MPSIQIRWARIHPFRLALASGVGDIGARRVHSYLGSITCRLVFEMIAVMDWTSPDLAAGKKGASVVDSEWPNDLLPDVLLVFLARRVTLNTFMNSRIRLPRGYDTEPTVNGLDIERQPAFQWPGYGSEIQPQP